MQADNNEPSKKSSWWELPTQYPRNMKAQEGYAWWKPILAFIVGFIVWMVVITVVSLAVSIASGRDFTADISLDPADPVMFAVALFGIALFTAVIAVVMVTFDMGGLKVFSSIEGKLRWDRIRAFAPWSLLLVVVFFGAFTVFGFLVGQYSLSSLRVLPASILVVIILAPLQSAGEEYLFRGFLFQAFSSWIPTIVIPLVLQAIIFGAMHSQYNIVGLIGCALMGVCSAYLACKTGGLEASICLHASNNVVSMLITCFFASVTTTYEVSIFELVGSIAMYLCVTVAVLRTASKKGWLLKK